MMSDTGASPRSEKANSLEQGEIHYGVIRADILLQCHTRISFIIQTHRDRAKGWMTEF
jgi:hypothetical protein